MDAFPTPEADSFAERAKAINERYQAALRKHLLIERLTLVLVSCSLMFGGTLVLENSLKQQAKINQEVIAWAK